MFNGIIYNQGIIKNIKRSKKYVSGSFVLEVKSKVRFKTSDIGESVCVDGVCLTLIKILKNSFLFYLSKETLKRSNFKKAKIDNVLNIEKSIKFGSKISGHFVQGHVDTTALVKKISIIDKSWVIDLRINSKYSKFLIEKGSISVNGVSLTVSKITRTGFQITIIPHTLKLTNLIKLKKGSLVNIEFDLFGKYLLNASK
tara:strand:+ start:1757 stop:2353 length:597 start_codon:yes stop_codon:yes gene_type:complete